MDYISFQHVRSSCRYTYSAHFPAFSMNVDSGLVRIELYIPYSQSAHFLSPHAAGIQLSEAVDEIYRLLRKHLEDMRGINISGFTDWGNVKGSIHAKLVNAEKNKEMLKKIPHRLFLDMAVVYYVVIGGLAAEGIGTCLISNEHMEMWGQNEGNLYQTAISNMRSDGEPCFDSMETVIKSIIPEDAGFWRNMVDVPSFRNCNGIDIQVG